jgi:hypothetical protein
MPTLSGPVQKETQAEELPGGGWEHLVKHTSRDPRNIPDHFGRQIEFNQMELLFLSRFWGFLVEDSATY